MATKKPSKPPTKMEIAASTLDQPAQATLAALHAAGYTNATIKQVYPLRAYAQKKMAAGHAASDKADRTKRSSAPKDPAGDIASLAKQIEALIEMKMEAHSNLQSEIKAKQARAEELTVEINQLRNSLKALDNQTT